MSNIKVVLVYEVYKLSKKIMEGNARKRSIVFLHWVLCDVIKSLDDHARMRVSVPLASLVRLRGRRIALISNVLSYFKATFGNIATHFWG